MLVLLREKGEEGEKEEEKERERKRKRERERERERGREGGREEGREGGKGKEAEVFVLLTQKKRKKLKTRKERNKKAQLKLTHKMASTTIYANVSKRWL